MIKLYLDTTTAKKSTVTIECDGERFAPVENDAPLQAINSALKTAGVKLSDVDLFKSNPGPGSYTGVRIGAAVVNSLNYAFGKKVALIEPVYS